MKKLLVHNPRRGKYKLNRPDERNCPFCTADAHIVIKDYQHWYVIANRYPFVDHAILIIPNLHVEYVHDLEFYQWTELLYIFQDLGKAWSKYYKSRERSEEIKALDNDEPSYNFYVNNGVFSGQTIRHLHWHFIPRVWRQDTAMELTEDFHKVKTTPEETAELFKKLLA